MDLQYSKLPLDKLELLIPQLNNKSYAILDDFLPPKALHEILNYAKNKLEFGEMRDAKIGTKSDQVVYHQRGDKILWLENPHPVDCLNDYFNILNNLLTLINRSFYLSLKRFESMIAYYPIGSFYKKHLDQHQNSPHRQISCILYLSPWTSNGGELLLDLKGENLTIEPIQNRFICFLSSEVPHEVMPVRAGERFSLTSWLRNDLDLFLN